MARTLAPPAQPRPQHVRPGSRAMPTEFRIFAFSQGISSIGTWTQRVAQDWLVLELSDGSATAVGITLALQFLPVLVFSIWGGSLGDRFSKRRILIVTQLGLGATSLAVGTLSLTGGLQLAHMYLAALCVGVLAAVDSPVRQAYTAELVEPMHLGDAVALNLTLNNAARIVGPMLAGLLISVLSAGWLFVGNAASFAATVAAFGWIGRRPRASAPRRDTASVRATLARVWRSADLRAVLAIVFVSSTFAMIFPVSLAAITRDVLGHDAHSYGVLCTMIAVGAIGGAGLARRRARLPSADMVLVAAAAFGALETCAGLMTEFVSIAVLLVATGAGMSTFTKMALTHLHVTAGDVMRCRIMGIYTLCTIGGWPLGAIALGWLADTFGPHSPLIAGGAVTMVASAGLALHRRMSAAASA